MVLGLDKEVENEISLLFVLQCLRFRRRSLITISSRVFRFIRFTGWKKSVPVFNLAATNSTFAALPASSARRTSRITSGEADALVERMTSLSSIQCRKD